MFPDSVKCATGNNAASYVVFGSSNLVVKSKCSLNQSNDHREHCNSYAVLGSGKMVIRSQCSLNRLNTPQGTLWSLIELATGNTVRGSWKWSIGFQIQMFPASIKFATGNIVRGSCKWYIFPNHQKYATETFVGLT